MSNTNPHSKHIQRHSRLVS